MSNEMVEVLNLLTGKRGRIRRRLFESPVFNDGILEEVEADQKPYLPEMFRGREENPTTEPEDAEVDETDADEEEDSL